MSKGKWKRKEAPEAPESPVVQSEAAPASQAEVPPSEPAPVNYEALKREESARSKPFVRNILAPNRVQVRGLDKPRKTTVDYLVEAKRKEREALAKKQAERKAEREAAAG